MRVRCDVDEMVDEVWEGEVKRETFQRSEWAGWKRCGSFRLRGSGCKGQNEKGGRGLGGQGQEGEVAKVRLGRKGRREKF